MAEFDHRSHGWPHVRQFVVARRFIPNEEAETTLFTMGRYMYRAWVTNMDLTAGGIWHFYDGRAPWSRGSEAVKVYEALLPKSHADRIGSELALGTLFAA